MVEGGVVSLPATAWVVMVSPPLEVVEDVVSLLATAWVRFRRWWVRFKF